MQILLLTPEIESQLQEKLVYFERQFTYPLGENTFFTIDHGDQYSAFFANLGQAHTWLAMDHGQIIGCVSLSIRSLYAHDRLWQVGYIGDLKIDPSHQRRQAFYRLSRTVQETVAQKIDFGYGVVMRGTSSLPSQYTGRLGIPSFIKGMEWLILKFSILSLPVPETHVPEILTHLEAQTLFLELASGHGWWVRSSHSAISSCQPEWVHVDRQAMGCYEDTRLGKQLFLTTGQELNFGHLTNIAFNSPLPARQVILYALRRAQSDQMQGLFMAVTQKQYQVLKSELVDLPHEIIIADVYLTNPHYSSLLTINTAEI